jgi:hypothetical protein
MKTLEMINSVRESRKFYRNLQESKEFKPRVVTCTKTMEI